MQGQSFNYKYNQTLKTFNTQIQCMFSEYSGSLNGRNAYDKVFYLRYKPRDTRYFLVQVCPIY